MTYSPIRTVLKGKVKKSNSSQTNIDDFLHLMYAFVSDLRALFKIHLPLAFFLAIKDKTIGKKSNLLPTQQWQLLFPFSLSLNSTNVPFFCGLTCCTLLVTENMMFDVAINP